MSQNVAQPQMSAEVVAREIRKWAQKNRMISHIHSEPRFDEQLINSVLSPVGVRAATSLLQNRGISYIGVEDEHNEVLIFLEKAPRVRDVKAFAAATKFGVPINLLPGGLAMTGRMPPPPRVPPFVHKGSAYTCGSSVYISTAKGAGTLGCLVRSKSDGMLYGLSNNHVTGGCNYAELALPIQAPGQLDIAAGQPDPFTIGHHYSVAQFRDGLPTIVDVSENLDAALFLVSDESRVSSYQRDSFDTPLQVGPMRTGMSVMKAGRTTGLTQGKVISRLPDPEPVIYEIDIIGGKKFVYFDDMFAIKNATTPFALPGDSGSLIVTTGPDAQKVAVGIVVATDNETLTLALPLDRICKALDVDIVSGHNI